MKRRALLLGALLIPMPARARTSSKPKQVSKKPPAAATKPKAKPAPPAGEERASSNDVTIDDRGLIYLVDRVRGVDIIETSAF